MENKKVIVTGGASGIGLAITKKFLSQGASVYILDFNETLGQEVLKKLRSDYNQVHFMACDVSNQHQVKEVFANIPSIDVLINNAGVSHVGNIEKTTEEDFSRLFNINVKGIYNCAQAAISKMKGKGGAILNMASIVSSVGIPDRFAYSMTKGAVLSMTYSIACDYVSEGIRCNCLSPARIHTPFVDDFLAKNYPGQEKEVFEKLAKTQPIGRMGTPEEVAEAAFFICSDQAKFITGTNFPVDGGFVSIKN
ncbi:SDR family NAD(P)-dependent oxidoreductase [Belliella kenyensis]|uniref:SDR family NAD(P)-dependent oxidoreductase n=1 Tax=Belliella kenyensis TaxID=1472724 RepID=A0ABV8EL32_9BACT|nr:SDR family oxidoreductase [Belliella kenyensis]MCH7403327.1 SDR family oxidoreductase [Belliella kenyensis]MDN3602968.1 SDR family oxidoreductase [Belliella kenyensis]